MPNDFAPDQEFDMNMRESMIQSICEKYPFISCDVIGKSVCQRDIHCLRIGSSQRPALFASAFHGMEWLTSLLVLLFADRVCNSIANNQPMYGVDMQQALDKQGLFIVPCVNPDGVEISINGAENACSYENLVNSLMNYGSTTSWQANARGVDINHNFNANWQELHKLEEANNITGPAPTRYGGPYPNSEPETRVVVNLCNTVDFRHAIAFHSQGEEIYWRFGENTPETSKPMAQMMAELSGYTLSSPEGLAIGGGFKDWFILKFSKPGFTVEIGKGKNPLPMKDISSIYRTLEKMLVYCSIV